MAIALAITASAFTARPAAPQTGQIWFDLTGSDPNQPSSYTPDKDNAQKCFLNTTICGVFANPQSGDPTHPDLNGPVTYEFRN